MTMAIGLNASRVRPQRQEIPIMPQCNEDYFSSGPYRSFRASGVWVEYFYLVYASLVNTTGVAVGTF
jgi:hypothetical protein